MSFYQDPSFKFLIRFLVSSFTFQVDGHLTGKVDAKGDGDARVVRVSSVADGVIDVLIASLAGPSIFHFYILNSRHYILFLTSLCHLAHAVVVICGSTPAAIGEALFGRVVCNVQS